MEIQAGSGPLVVSHTSSNRTEQNLQANVTPQAGSVAVDAEGNVQVNQRGTTAADDAKAAKQAEENEENLSPQQMLLKKIKERIKKVKQEIAELQQKLLAAQSDGAAADSPEIKAIQGKLEALQGELAILTSQYAKAVKKMQESGEKLDPGALVKTLV